jgi:hypothetical protein
MSRIEFSISFGEEKQDNYKLLRKFRVQLMNVKEQQNDFHWISPKPILFK